MIKWPDRLIEQIARRRAIPYMGAGFSRSSTNDAGKRPPLWETFLKTAKNECAQGKQLVGTLINQGRFLEACSIASDSLGQRWFDLVNEEFNAGYKKSKNHEHLYDLDCPIVITPNFDKIYETYAIAQSEGTVIVKSFSDDDLVRPVKGSIDSRLILKCHGTIDAPDRIIFTREKYAELIHKHPVYNATMNALFLTNTIIFIGTSGSDPDINLILERHAQILPKSAPHYFISADRQTHKMAGLLKKSYNLEVLKYKPDNYHEELTISLDKLRELVAIRRTEMADTLQW